ncbi:DUF488 family protein [Nostoc sp.]|uniref:DUF488 domain-containing protein n=1 Tax=Nostoc sp. TaxID=1180 RepID=UPI003592FF3A
MKLFTVGHSNLNIEAFITLLQKHEVTALADVRSYPYSRYLPHFNQTELNISLSDKGIRYVFLGRELGARPSDLTCYVAGKALYENIAATELFAEGIERIIKGVKTYKIALMCAEKDPITCHRTILVCQHLRSCGLEISHILQDGSLETHQHLEDRLLNLHGLNYYKVFENRQLSLFDVLDNTNNYSKEDATHEAYKKQGEKIAYVDKKGKYYEKVS